MVLGVGGFGLVETLVFTSLFFIFVKQFCDKLENLSKLQKVTVTTLAIIAAIIAVLVLCRYDDRLSLCLVLVSQHLQWILIK